MIAEQLISDTIVPLRTSDTGANALSIMTDFFIRHLPIVNKEELLGLLSEDDVLDHDAAEPVGSYQLSLHHPFVREKDHLYDVLRLIAEHQLTVIPVIDSQRKYIGLITLEDLVRHLVELGAFKEPGGIVVLEMGRQDYSLAEIARIVESENAVILSCQVQSDPESSRIDVTIKINRQNIQSILATFERFNYQVKASFNEAEYFDTLRERYDGLMTYLNV